MIIYVTGTNTDVGKTVATAALASAFKQRGREVIYAKPLQTGEPEGKGDAATVGKLAGVEIAEMVRFPEPLAPNLSARRAGMPQPSLQELKEWIAALDAPGRVVLVEGAGGLLVRLTDAYTLADVADRLLIVTSLNLGSLNAAELTVREAQRRGIEVLGLVGGSLPADPDLATRLNLEEMPEVTGCTFWGSLPEGMARMAPADFARVAAEVYADFVEHAE